MSTPTASPPEPPRFRPDPAGDAFAPPPRGGRAGAPLAVLLCMSALLGGGVSAGALAATGALDGSGGSTTTVVRTASAASSAASSGSALEAGSLYAGASPGVVDITAKGVSSGQDTATG